jgi:Ner family transcriptional regulator
MVGKAPVPVSNNWHKADIKAALEKAGWTLRGLARHHSVTHASLAQAFRSSYPASERRIAAAIGVPASKIWPERYAQRSKRGRAGHAKNSRAD